MSAPLGAGGASLADHQAAEQLALNEAGRVELVRARAEKWIGGVAAMTGVLTTALVIKGPDDITKIDTNWRIGIVAVLAVAITALTSANYYAYEAAYGQPGRLDELKAIPLTGLHQRLLDTRREVARAAQSSLATAITLAGLGVFLVAASVGITWFAPEAEEKQRAAATCIYEGSTLVAKVKGDSLTLQELRAGSVVKPCK